jgi:hypothetical protein
MLPSRDFSATFYIDYIGLLNFILNAFGSNRSLQMHIVLYYVVPELNFCPIGFILNAVA